MKKKGIGYASTFYGTGYGNGFPDESRATAKIESNGTINIYVEVSDVGSGGKSVMWQIATKTLNIDEKLVNIINTNTSTMKDSGTAAASRQTYNTGNAVLNACNKLRDNINNVINKTEKITSSDQIKNILQDMSKNNISTFEDGYFKATTSKIHEKDGQGNPYWPYTFGAQRATVIVDTETGKVDILEIVAVNDAGKIINPTLAEGQVEGGCLMGMGYALMEEINLNKGKIKNTNFSNYIIPTSMDMPNIKSYFVEENESTGPFGAKGLGEPVMLPTAPAILNAIYDAIGVRFYELPVTCEKVLVALKRK
ncbi:molybdopterin cofactor-binding domain-containing protein [uncultured Clostridium sp.]|uniref:xanthine dehydrogenase family protein molybdopterin-binding subunit n=1 Tax=uncultured Clostridium sp. TaxID=59620 RepID=UPI00280C1319|nr:molybdopterin cofactor-binding domain-containing protein [uncultured Clostridium sp.]